MRNPSPHSAQDKPPQRKWTKLIAIASVAALTVYLGTRPAIKNLLTWAWHMTHIDEYGMNGMHLEPGREYYFPPSAPYFDYDYFQVKPVDAAEIEQDELIGIGTVRSDQKRDYMYGYRRVRTKYTPRIDTAALRLVRNGDYFLSVDETGRAANLVSIDEAIRLPKYVKVTVYLQKVVEAELVDRVGETHVQFKYWTTTGYRQELVSFDIDEGVRTDHRLCYAEADGRRTPCSDSQKKP